VTIQFRPVFIDNAVNVMVESFPLLDRQFSSSAWMMMMLTTILVAC